ncbi:MAG: S8 family serine peptidase [Candidatus Sericytochromatia bacterium]|nr:S8 family serine peptidase [Candidatus Sericytochromatia bacterium]
MNRTAITSAAILVALLTVGCGNMTPSRNSAPLAAAQTRFPAGNFTAQGVSKRQIVVKLKGQRLPQSLLRQGPGAPRITSKIQSLRALVLDNAPGADSTKLLASLRADAAVAYAHPVQLAQMEKTVDDPRVAEQYSLKIAQVDQAWDLQMGGAGVVVAVIDSGIDMGHPDLKGNIVPESWNVLDKNNDPRDDHGHGTHCAGIAAAIANNGEGVAGVAPKAGLMAVKVLDARGRGSDATIAEGVVHATDKGAKVITMSLGLYKRSPVLEEALQYALDRDVVLVASAGNNNALNDPTSAPHLPSTHPGVIEVAATDDQDKKARFSNFGKTVSVAAPGVNILSTLPTYKVGREVGYGKMSGTSMASPFVAGLAALVRSEFPAMKQAEVKAHIEKMADDLGAEGFDQYFGHGRINALKSVSPLRANRR